MEKNRVKISYKKFFSQIIKCFVFTTIKTVLSNISIAVVIALFFQEIKNDYSELFPWYLQKILGNLTKEKFILLGVVLAIFLALTDYLENLWKEKLIIQLNDYNKNCLLKKFRKLPLEEKIKVKKEISTLVQIESNIVSNYWVYFNTSIYAGVLYSLILIINNFDKSGNFAWRAFYLAIFWLVLISLTIYFFVKLTVRYGEKYKKELAKENSSINQEIDNAILIDSMGLTSDYEKNQQIVTEKNQKIKTSFRNVTAWSKIIPNNLLVNIYPFFLLLLLNKEFKELGGKNLNNIWLVLNNLVWIFGSLWDYGDYSSSRSRINNFLSLPEKNENLQQLKLNEEISLKAIKLENISFRYQGQNEWILDNYNHSFLSHQINYLRGRNGAGKTTIFYLILGILKPQKGKIIVETIEGQVYELQRDINLQHWREKKVAYCSHDNLIEEGSTGQRQLTNINKILMTKERAQVFLFDETDNALDKEKRKEFEEKVGKLTNRIVIKTAVNEKEEREYC